MFENCRKNDGENECSVNRCCFPIIVGPTGPTGPSGGPTGATHTVKSVNQ